MGWNPFKSKTKITVSTMVSRVIEDKLVPDSMKTGTIKGIFEGDQLVENIMEDMVASVGIRAERMYQYAKTKYPRGVPRSKFLCNVSGKDVVQLVLNEIAGKPVTIEYYHYGALNNLHSGWLVLMDEYGYDPVANTLGTLSTEKGVPVYLSDMQVVVTNATATELVNGSLEQWGKPANAGYTPLRPTTLASTRATPYAIDASAAQDYFRVSYVWKEGTVCKSGLFTFPIGDEDPNLGYFQAKYSDGTTSRYWTYRDGEGSWPALDGVFNTGHDTLGTFFPFGYFRYEKQSMAENAQSTEYKTSTKLMKFLGIDFAEVASSIDENPDIADVESALLMLAVPAETSNEVEQRYLFDFFKGVYLASGGKGYPASALSQSAGKSVAETVDSQISLVIQDNRFKMSVSMDGIYRKVCSGKIGAIGTYGSGKGSRTLSATRTVYASIGDPTGTPVTTTTTVPCHYYQHQITASLYEEIQVYDLDVLYYVWGKYTASGNSTDKNLLIPLDRAITSQYSPSVREKLYSRSLHYVFNAKVETKIKWYQQGWFRIFMTIVAIVITIFSMGGLSGVSAAIMAATATSAALLSTVITLVLNYLIFTVALKYFVKVLGAKVAMILAVVAVAFGVYSQMAGGVASAPWATDLIKVASGLTNAISDHFTDALLKVKKEADLFSIYAKEQTELLEDTNKLLEGNNLLSPFVVFGESPSDYYARTVHSGNIGILGIEAVTSYVDTSLTLPTLPQTLGDNFNGFI